MKRTFLFFAFFLICRAAQADVILLKNGQVFEGKVTPVRNIFIRVQPDYGKPFREFLIENVAYIEQTNPNEVSHQAIKNIHQNVINKFRGQDLQEEVNKKAAVLVEDAIQNSEALSLNGASDEVKAIAQEKASALIGEAVRRAETPELIGASMEIKNLAEEKDSGVIEPAVKDVEILPLQNAPEGVQIAAKKAATTFIEGAVIDVETQIQSQLPSEKGLVFTWPVMINFSNWENLSSNLQWAREDGIIGGLLILVLLMLLREKSRKRKKVLKAEKKTVLALTLKELDKELADFDEELTKKKHWAEKRKYTRAKREFPISLILDKVKPISAIVKDISLGGAYAICNDIKLFKLGTRCEFKSKLIDAGLDFGIKGMAEVVWIRSTRGLGLKFFQLDEDSLNYLLKI
ncbi:MAG: PilZ domain-containing protein [Candidatus Omnitrophica bacterium]|nr:PilZ domain-containing protein [Candidatus Omnitrophota bacterium]